ncbi:MAG: DUF4159 domain-containing protein, partial [Planctomycetota bacterium]
MNAHKRNVVLVLVAALSLTAMAPGAPRTYRRVADEDIDRTISEIQRYLRRQQQGDGRWRRHHRRSVPRGGTTALALFALLEAGENPRAEHMRKGLEYLAAVETNNLYTVATRTMVLGQVAELWKDNPWTDQLRKDVAWLLRGAARYGAWGYGGPERYGDNSCAQFALMALWQADRAGLNIPPAVLRRAEGTWLRRQRRDDGGWTYAGQPRVEAESTASMTTAALASLFLCRDVLSYQSGPYRHQEALDKGFAFLDENLKEGYVSNGYLAFCVQRVGLASGRKWLGELDWFAAGASRLCAPTPYGRRYRGTWGPIVRASFELIFLARGRIPLTFNKLQHPGPAWNWHSRDLPRFTEYMRRTYERRMRWQIVKITDDPRLLLDAPIVLVEGKQQLELTDEQWSKLREYTLRGGTLLFVPVSSSRPFRDSAVAALKDLYAEQRAAAGKYYQLEPLDENHPIYTAYEKLKAGPAAAPIQAVSDGTRVLAAVCKRDIAAAWQQRAARLRSDDFVLGANFLRYATGGNDRPGDLRPVFTGTASEARHEIKIARIRHEGNWNTQPYALDVLAEKLLAENRATIDVTSVALKPGALKGVHLAWLTGSDPFTLPDEQVQVLAEFLDRGGMLFVNAVGGSRVFNRSAKTLIRDLLPAASGAVPGEDSPLLTGKCGDFRGPPIEEIKRTIALTMSEAGETDPLEVYRKLGRVAVVHGPYGIHDTLDG